jgi:shikimate kinase
MGHVFLTGFMGSGKTTLGKKLGRIMNYPFIDLDDYIMTKEGKTITQIFEESGELAFRNLEALCLEKVLEKEEPSVIALGGGTICFGTNLAKVRHAGLLIYIELPAATLASRLGQGKTPRPLLKGIHESEMQRAIEALLQQRKKFYTQAHIILNGLNLTPHHLHQAILAELPKHTV